MSNFDVANLALASVCPSNEMIYDDTGMPSVMVKIPKCTWADLGIGDSTETFPAFIINGKEVDEFCFSKYINMVQNNRAYSLPGQDPAALIDFDTSMQRSEQKGEGWHLQTDLEWMAVSLWSLKNGTLPNGNSNYGKDETETVYKAIPSSPRDTSGRICRTATGTGPLTWSHNHAPDGIFDMKGDVWEWGGGKRMVFGELQVISRDGKTFGNDAADPDNSQAANSALWYAIDGTTGELIKPNGSGTTKNSLKLDMVGGAWQWITGALADSQNASRNKPFASTTCDSTVCTAAKHKLMALGMLPLDGVESTVYSNDVFYCNNGAEERLFYRGGCWNTSSSAGVFAVSGSSARSLSSAFLGFRSAFVKLPAD